MGVGSPGYFVGLTTRQKVEAAQRYLNEAWEELEREDPFLHTTRYIRGARLQQAKFDLSECLKRWPKK